MEGSGAGGEGATLSTLALVLLGPTVAQPVGRPVDVEVEVRNQGTEDVWMVGVIDGSEEGIRYPHYRPSVTRGGIIVAAPSPPEDPLVGPLRVSDFRRLGPGEAFDPTGADDDAAYLPLSTFASFHPAEPGVYRYQLAVSTESEMPEAWLGRFGQDTGRAAVLELITRVPRVTVTANVLEVEVG
jgi:hypothetical protein